MIHKKRLLTSTLFAALLCGTAASGLHAQDSSADRPRPMHAPPPMPLFDALDTNHDGIISADEIANASTALKALLKNGATQLSRDDLRPPRPANDDRNRDDSARSDWHPRPHHPPMDDQAAGDAAPPHPAAEEDRADHPHHRPPPPESADGDSADEPRSHHPLPDARPEHPPRGPESDAAPLPGHDGDAEADHAPRPPHLHGGPLFDALDTNHDGVISADEIDHASEALRKLDKSGTGQLRREDFRPPHPPHADE